jgi:hypothetical protein
MLTAEGGPKDIYTQLFLQSRLKAARASVTSAGMREEKSASICSPWPNQSGIAPIEHDFA